MGTAIAKKIIEEHKVGIAIDTAPGKGTKVHVTLPRTEDVSASSVLSRP
jgi:signal transduction histidine kinase